MDEFKINGRKYTKQNERETDSLNRVNQDLQKDKRIREHGLLPFRICVAVAICSLFSRAGERVCNKRGSTTVILQLALLRQNAGPLCSFYMQSH